MSDARPRLMPIGRFSEVSGLSIKALRNYDEFGLLEPAYVDDDTGYRYYTLGQTNRAEAIRLLRTVDLPLAEIRAVLDEKDRAAVAGRLEAHRARLERRHSDVQRTLGFLQDLIEREEGILDRASRALSRGAAGLLGSLRLDRGTRPRAGRSAARDLSQRPRRSGRGRPAHGSRLAGRLIERRGR